MTSEEIMKACMVTNTYEGCEIKKCRACSAKKECSKESWIKLGGVAE
jgi:hypothetical protein